MPNALCRPAARVMKEFGRQPVSVVIEASGEQVDAAAVRRSAYTLVVLELRRVTDPKDPAITAFGHLQAQTYFEPDMLIPTAYISGILERGDGSRENALLVVEDDGVVVAGSIFHYLRPANAGFSSYLGVAASHRGRGLARRLHEARFDTLDELAGRRVEGVLIDVVNPKRLSSQERDAERTVGSDPEHRLEVFSSLGFRRVDVRYVQPTGGADGGPVTNMDLLFCPHDPDDFVRAEVVVTAMRTYWKPWLNDNVAQREARALEAQARDGQFALLPL
jgi:GNAT superfamily N-acetyltransferase